MLTAITKVVAGLFGLGISAYAAASALTFTHHSVRELAGTAGESKSSPQAKTALGG